MNLQKGYTLSTLKKRKEKKRIVMTKVTMSNIVITITLSLNKLIRSAKQELSSRQSIKSVAICTSSETVVLYINIKLFDVLERRSY